ncbi:MAG: penicillin-binding transpeptidase domain-containing protein, partial [Clostridia bacterium]
IGQGTLQVTPLQVATFIAALGNGGTLYQPQLVEQYTDVNGNPASTFTPIVNGQLPISDDTLNSITEAMRWVTGQPRGTAWGTFSTLRYPVYAKTGTAQTSVCPPCPTPAEDI